MSILYKDQYTFTIVSSSFLLRMKNVSLRNCRETRNTYFVSNSPPSPKIMPLMRQGGKILYSRTGHRWQYGAHALRAGTEDYKHKIGICNTYCLSTATMVARTRLDAMLKVHCLSCLLYGNHLLNLRGLIQNFPDWRCKNHKTYHKAYRPPSLSK